MLPFFVLALNLTVLAPRPAMAESIAFKSASEAVETVHVDMLNTKEGYVLNNKSLQFKPYKNVPAPPCSMPYCPVSEEHTNDDNSAHPEGESE